MSRKTQVPSLNPSEKLDMTALVACLSGGDRRIPGLSGRPVYPISEPQVLLSDGHIEEHLPELTFGLSPSTYTAGLKFLSLIVLYISLSH